MLFFLKKYLFIIFEYSSTRFPSPNTIGPSLAIIIAFGCMTQCGPIVMSPSKVASSHTTASGAIIAVVLKNKYLCHYSLQHIARYQASPMAESQSGLLRFSLQDLPG